MTTSNLAILIFLGGTLMTGANGQTPVAPSVTQPATPPGPQPIPQPGSQPAAPPALKLAPATPIDKKREDLGGKTWDAAWDIVIEKSLPPDLLSARAGHAVRGFCPRFDQETEASKREFWAYLFQALAGAEAGLNPTSNVHHLEPEVNKIDRVTKHRIHQEGLLQLTYEDSKRYGCNFDYEKDKDLPPKDPARTILDPTNNLTCGIKIMEDQIITHKRPLISPRSYWATLHPGTLSYHVFRKQMANVPKDCGVGVDKPRPQRDTHP